ncbi:mitochondrial dicarboxylate carrier-like [Drosophila innubila]|uniref:mitochondrial dicarboxylate carrier-like n=1 Tax=Drosophila innubila TaxID=198719 RepID=UPI00148D15A9|nr:mitochondrial dicarboxylate carrier-like [Drosophila innubila]
MATEKHSRWYFGGLASVFATCTTHPLDLLKVALQTHQGKLPLLQLVVKIVNEQGVLAFYRGISASVLRQIMYSTTRFGAYEIGKDYVNTNTFGGKILLAGLSGMLGGVIGSPADLVNVRMQNDVKLPREKRSNYKNAIDGIYKAYRQEGFRNLFSGGVITTLRGGVMTIGQIAFYDQIKFCLLNTVYFDDNLVTHFTTSLLAGIIATTLTQPLDVLKTRTMTAKPGEFSGMRDIIKYTGKLGPHGFFKGYVPAFLRVGPQTILTFLFLEQLRLHFGYEKIRPTVYRYGSYY